MISGKNSESEMLDKVLSTNPKRINGYSLVELLVGLTISLMVGSVAITFMLSSSRMLSTQSAEDAIQENARFALEILASSVRLAGSNTSSDLQTQTLSQGVFRGSICGASKNEACNNDNQSYSISSGSHGGTTADPTTGTTDTTTGTSSPSGPSATTDRFAVEHITDQGLTCTGQVISSERQVVQVYYVADNAGVSSLYCEAYESVLDFATQNFETYTASGNAVPLIDGVEMLQIQYGVDIDGTADGTIDRYVTYSNLTANTAWFNRIKAIKIGMILSNSQESATGNSDTETRESRTYQVLDGMLEANDAVLRQAITTTVYLPNSDINI